MRFGANIDSILRYEQLVQNKEPKMNVYGTILVQLNELIELNLIPLKVVIRVRGMLHTLPLYTVHARPN